MDTPLQKRGRGGCSLKRILVVGITGGGGSLRLAPALRRETSSLMTFLFSKLFDVRLLSIGPPLSSGNVGWTSSKHFEKSYK